jgi:hypothetical protein
MKTSTIINKIITQIETHAEIMKNLLSELDESCEKENIKIKHSVAKKIATSFDLDIEQVLKKVIKRKKKNSDFDSSDVTTSESIDFDKDFVPIYKKIIYDDEEFYYDDKPDGFVFRTNAETLETKIVGYIEYDTKSIKFM